MVTPVETPSSLTVVIPVRNDAARLSACLTTLKGEPGSDEAVVIVADNGSTDESLAVARAHGAICLCLPGLSVAQMRNRAVREVKTPLVALIDADHLLEPGWLAACLALMSDPSVAAGGAPYLAPTPGTWVQGAYDRFRTRPISRTDTDWLGSGNLVIRREVFERIGGFDETLETCEDVDLCNRLRRIGARLVIEPAMRSVHQGDPATIGQLFVGELWRGRDNIRVTMRGPLTARALASVVIPVFLLAMFVAAVVGLAVAAIDARGLLLIPLAVAGLVGAALLRVGRMASAGGTVASRLGGWLAVAVVYEAARALALVARATHTTRRQVGERRA